MKKTILLFLFVIPVIIVILVVAIAGFVGRQVMFIEIRDVRWDEAIFESRLEFNEHSNTHDLIVLGNRGDVIPFMRYIIVEPADASESLTFVSSNPEVVDVINGHIHILQNMRSTDPSEGIEIRVMHGIRVFFTVFVMKEEADENYLDYFGFSFDLFRDWLNRDAEREWRNELGLPAEVGIYNRVIIEREFMAEELGGIIPISNILERGYNVAPNNLLISKNPLRQEFLNSLAFESSNSSILQIMPSVEGGVFNARILSEGEVEIRIIMVDRFLGSQFSISVPVLIV
ncbi:MAG: hypothetical protein FWE13_01080 [Firmicutes bacterium]|nr:hypothetical protein [Bacillota bacterium]